MLGPDRINMCLKVVKEKEGRFPSLANVENIKIVELRSIGQINSPLEYLELKMDAKARRRPALQQEPKADRQAPLAGGDRTTLHFCNVDFLG